MGKFIPDKSLTAAALAILAALTLSACNTFEGMGRDMQQTGEAMEGEAEEERRQ